MYLKLKETDGSVILPSFKRRCFSLSGTPPPPQMHGLGRTIINNMVVGVVGGFEKKMTLVGVGYRAKMEGRKLVMSVGYTHDVVVELPQGINATVTANTNLVITGIDKEAVGNFSASLRRSAPPEPYGGKGVRFADEVIKLKEGKVKGKK